VAFIETIDKVADRLDRPIWYICWITLAGSTLLSFTVVIMRYVFNLGYIWLDEICRYSFIAIVYLWAGPIARIGGHIRLEVVTARLTQKGLEIHSLLVNACICFTCILIVYWGTTLIQLSIMLDEKSESFVFSIWCLHSLVALGMSLYAFYSFLGILKALAKLFGKKELTSSASVG
jgi:C4-dicarboxylate transporter, DctQ subunit